MKELSIEEKAKAYDEAREKIAIRFGSNVADEIFSQFEMSEDEKMRNVAINACKYMVDNFENSTKQYEDAIAWLEKQGEHNNWKPSKEEMDVLYGLAYITNQYDEHKEEVITHLYQDLKREFFNGSSYENMFPNTEDGVRRRSTIQVLEYARSLDAYNQYGKADIDKNIAWLETQGEQKPADKLELKKIEWNDCKTCGFRTLAYKQNTAWTEEDNEHVNSLLKRLEGLCRKEFTTTRFAINEDEDWLKSLKDRVQPQPQQEWGEEDEKMLNSIIHSADNHCYINVEERDWLKSLRPHNTWKPSDEQINGIECAIKTLQYQLNAGDNRLDSLYEDLKKLRGNSYDCNRKNVESAKPQRW